MSGFQNVTADAANVPLICPPLSPLSLGSFGGAVLCAGAFFALVGVYVLLGRHKTCGLVCGGVGQGLLGCVLINFTFEFSSPFKQQAFLSWPWRMPAGVFVFVAIVYVLIHISPMKTSQARGAREIEIPSFAISVDDGLISDEEFSDAGLPVPAPDAIHGEHDAKPALLSKAPKPDFSEVPSFSISGDDGFISDEEEKARREETQQASEDKLLSKAAKKSFGSCLNCGSCLKLPKKAKKTKKRKTSGGVPSFDISQDDGVLVERATSNAARTPIARQPPKFSFTFHLSVDVTVDTPDVEKSEIDDWLGQLANKLNLPSQAIELKSLTKTTSPHKKE